MAFAAGAAIAVAGLGGLMTDIGPWYLSLNQPAWKPPDRALGSAWRSAPSRASREWLLGQFALNGFLNVLWSLMLALRRVLTGAAWPWSAAALAAAGLVHGADSVSRWQRQRRGITPS